MVGEEIALGLAKVRGAGLERKRKKSSFFGVFKERKKRKVGLVFWRESKKKKVSEEGCSSWPFSVDKRES